MSLNPIALRKANIVCNLGLSEGNRVKILFIIKLMSREVFSAGMCLTFNRVYLKGNENLYFLTV